MIKSFIIVEWLGNFAKYTILFQTQIIYLSYLTFNKNLIDKFYCVIFNRYKF